MNAFLDPRSADRRRPPTVPIGNVFLHVTKACNLRCAYCYFSADRPLANEMTAGEMASLWPDLVALAPHKVIFTGGEPFLRRDLFDLLTDLRAADPEHRVRRCLNTNGHLMTAGRARRLIGLADEVRVSLDAFAERNDAGRGAGNFAAAMAALDHLLRAGFEPRVLVTVTTATLPDLEDLLCHLVERRISRINVNPFRAIVRTGDKGYRCSETWVTVLTVPSRMSSCAIWRLAKITFHVPSWVVGTSPTGYPANALV